MYTGGGGYTYGGEGAYEVDVGDLVHLDAYIYMWIIIKKCASISSSWPNTCICKVEIIDGTQERADLTLTPVKDTS